MLSLLTDGSAFLCVNFVLTNSLKSLLSDHLWFIISVDSSVCQTITFECIDVASLCFHILYISRQYGSSSYMKIIGSRSRSRSRSQEHETSKTPVHTFINNGQQYTGKYNFASGRHFPLSTSRVHHRTYSQQVTSICAR